MFDDFKKDTLAAWKERVAAELKGKTAGSLVWENEDGLEVEPYYTSENSNRLFPVIHSRQNEEWDIFEHIDASDIKLANSQALAALKNGASGICFHIPEAIDAPEMSALLHEIGLPFIQNGFVVKPSQFASFCLCLAEYIRQQGFHAQEVTGFIQADFTRVAIEQLPDALNEYAADVPACAAALKGMRLFVIDASFYRELGCNASTELAIMLSWFREWLDMLGGMGIRYDQVSSLIQVNLGNSGDYFLELAKYRISNFLLSRVAARYGNFKPVYILGNTARYNKSLLDADTNLLRATTESMSAVSGLCNGLLTHPYKQNGEAEFARRISRNIQLLLQHEAHLGMPADPASGAYYPEALSFALAEKAWSCFLDIEDAGGLGEALKNGHLFSLIEDARDKKTKAVKNRKIFQLGVNQFPAAPAKLNDPKPGKPNEKQLPFIQSAPFEDLHRAVIRFGEKRGKEVNAALLTFGDVAMRNARAGFMRNFLGCAGVRVNEMVWDKKTLPEADFVVLCSSDEEYEAVLPLINNNNSSLLILAGNPAGLEEKCRAAGIHHLVHARSPLYDTLTALLNHSGIIK